MKILGHRSARWGQPLTLDKYERKVSDRETRFERDDCFLWVGLLRLYSLFAIKERHGDLAADRCYWIREPKTSQAKRPEAYLWRMLEMSVW